MTHQLAHINLHKSQGPGCQHVTHVTSRNTMKYQLQSSTLPIPNKPLISLLTPWQPRQVSVAAPQRVAPRNHRAVGFQRSESQIARDHGDHIFSQLVLGGRAGIWWQYVAIIIDGFDVKALMGFPRFPNWKDRTHTDITENSGVDLSTCVCVCGEPRFESSTRY